MTAELDDWGLLSIADVIGEETKPQAASEKAQIFPLNELLVPFRSLGGSDVTEQCIMMLISCLKNDSERRMSSMEDVFRNRSQKIKRSLETCERIRELYVEAMESFSSSASHYEKRNSAFESVSLLGAAIIGKENAAYSSALLDSIARVDWAQASSVSCVEVLHALYTHIDENKMSSQMRTTLCTTKLWLALQSGRLSSLTKALVHPDATSQLPEPIKGPLPKPASLLPDFELIQTSMDSFMTCSCSFPYSVETKGVDCCMDGGNLMVCCGGTMTQFESMGMMGSRLHRRDEFRIDVERGERVLSSQMGVITTIRCISRHDSGRAYRLSEWSCNHEVQRSATVDIRISRLHAVSSAFHFSMWEDSLSCLVTSENSNKVRSRMYVAAVTVDDVFIDNRFEWEMDPESSLLWRDAAKMSSSKALHFTKTTAVSLGRVTMKDHFHPFCIELWAYPRNLSEKQTVFSIGDKGTDEILIEIEPSGDGLLWRGGSRTPQLGASFTSYNCPGKLSSAERWWHVALNFTGTTWELWLDGQVASRHESLVSPEPIRDAKCHLGKSFAGLLAEVRVWNQVRNGTELRRDSRRALRGSEPDLIAYFPLDENNGNLIVDYSKNAEHVLMGHGSLKWSTLEVFPTTRPDVPRLTADFVPLAELEDRENMFFCVSPYYFRIAVLSLNSPHGPAITIFQYRRSDHSLYSQIRIECSNTWRLKGLAVNSSKDSILCWAVSTEKPSEMMLWDVHSYAVCSMVPMQNVYSSVWSCGRDVLQNASTLSQRFLSADKYLTDQSSWTAAIPPHLVDFDEELIPLLLELAHKAAGEVDEELSSCVCVLLRANLFFRFTMDEEKMRRDFDAPYPSHTALLSVLGPDSGKEERGSCRDAIVKLAFLPFASRSNLLQMCCQCFMTESCRIAFLKATAGKARSANEDVLFACVVEYYSMLQTCNSIIKSPDQAHVLYNALILEATYQVERSIRENNFSSLKRTSRCLEVFQEMLFAHLLKDSENSELSTLGLNYCKTLLRASEKTVYAMVKAYRKHPHVEYPFGTSLEISIVGALLPSLAVSLPLLPTVVLSACSVTLQSCRESLSSLDDAMPNKAQWVSDLGVAVTFSLCLIGCSMLHAVPEVAVNENVEIKYLNLMRNGIRKTGTERDVLIKNLQQGVGAISKIFEELQKADRTALCVVRDEQLKMIERQVMAAFCALTVPTKELKEASKASLEPVYRHVLKMRPWVLSKRQESRNLLQPIENKARFLAQFDVCYHTGTDLIAPSNLRHRTKEENTQSKWKKLFKQWKAMRALKALLTTQSDHSSPLIYSEITDFIEGSVDCTELERLVAWRSQKATYRLGGLLLLKQLTGEARVSPALSSILLPVMTKMLSGWHYAEGVECCSSESLLHVHGAFFQLFDTTLSKYLEERPENREPWAVLLISLFTSKWRSMDFVKVRSDVPRAFRMMWGAVDKDNNPRTAFKKRVNGILPPAGRETKLVARGAAPSLIVGDSGLTIKSVGGRGTCVAPYVWRENNKLRFTYYYEVYLVELVPGSSFSLGVGPVDYSLSRMPGWDANSFALQSDEGILFTGSASGRITGCSFRSGDVIGCGWNQSKKEIFWTKNGVFLTSCEGFPEELSPILGFDGKGIAQVNFGTDLFLYTQLERKETQLKDIPNARIANDAWDAFRIFSLQATSSLARSASNSHAQDSRKETISCVGMCFTALGDELTDLCIPGRPMSENSAKAYRLKIVLAHCSTLVQLLSKTPREFTPPDVTHLVATIERVSLALLQTPSTSTDVLIALLMTWFHVVDLIPLSDASEATAETSAAGAGSPVSAFLQTLISLALRLPFHSRDANSETCLQDLLISARLWQNPSEEVLWVALALLQRMNRDGTGLVPHAGESVLHQWIVRILHTSVKATREVQLALFILGGGPRFAVVGDKVLVRRAQHSQSSYTLMRYSLSEEICDVIDDEGKFRTLPLRIVDLVIGDDEGQCYFPVVGHATHAVQAEEVLQCAMRMLEAVAIRHSVEAVSVQGQLLSILWRCTVRGVTQFPQRLVPSLARLSEAMELSTRLDIRNVRADIVFTENCCTVFQHHRAQSVLGSLSDTNLNNSTNITCSNTHVTEGRGEMSPASELSGLDDGRSRERDLSDSENDESRYLTALNDELADDEELELEEEEDEEESDLSNRDYPDDLGPSTGSDGMEEEEAQETGFAPNSDMVEESFEAIHFNRGCLRVISNRTVGQTYTIDFHVRLGDIFGHQILFVQQVNTRSHMSTEIIARVRNGGIDYGWIESVPGEERGASTGEMCRCSLSAEDRGTWVRLTFVQSELALWLFKNGTLQESKETRHAGGSLLEEEFFLGGVPEDSRSSFVGDLKDIRIYDTAMRPAMVDQLHSLNSSLAAFVDAHLCVVLRARRDGFDNFSKSSAAILLDIMREGEVEYVESSNLHSKKKELDTCTPELDFGCDAEDAEVFSFDTTSGLIGTSSHQVALWRKKQELTPEQLLLSHGKSWKQLSSYYSTSILASVLNVMPSDSRDKPHEPAATSADVVAADSTRRIVQLAVASSDSHLYDVLEGTLIRTASQHPQHQGAPSVSFGNEALKYLTQIAQREQRTRVFESAHPLRSTVRSSTEVHVPGQAYYHLLFDVRTLASNMVLTFAADAALTNTIRQAPAYALSSFSINLPRFFFDVRSDASSPQWGYKISVVYDCQSQLRSMRLLRSTLSASLRSIAGVELFDYFRCGECLRQLGHVARINGGKTRRLALSCISDLLLHSVRLSLPLPFFPQIHEIRRMAERQHRRRMGQTLHSRFVQVSAECYGMYRDALHCGAHEAITGDPATEEQQQNEAFTQHRLEQRVLYRQRDSADRITIQKVTDPHNLHVEWNTERICVARSEASGGSMIAGVALSTGRWYYEMRLGGSGFISVGVMPNRAANEIHSRPNTDMSFRGIQPIAFNGHTGMSSGRHGADRRETDGGQWSTKDYVGVLLDIPNRRCHFFVNGIELDYVLDFGGEEAASAAAQDLSEDTELSFYPYFFLDHSDTVTINFGGSYFEYEPPRGCLPLDPTNLSLGTLLPYNQMRAFHDLSAHVLTGGSHPIPPFFYEEADPFAESTERSGPAHVSLHAVDGIQLNLLEVKNAGTSFGTVTADCSVSGGCWYYEITLRTQGLMQVGWMLKSGQGDGSVGDTSTSWSIDLFRRLKWHNGRPEAVTVPRRWAVGDVIGCAIDLQHRELTFTFNGRQISGGALTNWTFHDIPVAGAEYVPAISLRSGNGVSFNFGSSAFKYKPEGFNALGVSDSWCERMDTFYSNEQLSSTCRRLTVLRQLWSELGEVTAAQPDTIHSALEPYLQLVSAVDNFAKETGKGYAQMTASVLKERLTSSGGSDPALLERTPQLLEVLLAVARVAQVSIPFFPANTVHPNILTKLFLVMRTVLFRSLRVNLVEVMLKETNVRPEHFRLYINRVRARAQRTSLKASIFGQTFSLMADQHPRMFQTNKRYWNTVLMGEGAEDVGGPFREHMNEMCQELMSTNLPFFVPTANNLHNTGGYRDAVLPAAACDSPHSLACYVFIGKMMGGAMRSEEPLGFNFPPLVWRYLSCYPITESHLDEVDRICLQCVREFRGLRKQGGSQEAFNDIFDGECFVTRLSDGSVKELIPNGSTIKVTFERSGEYAEALLASRLHECDLQLKMMREGMLQVVPEMTLLLLTPEELEARVCGRKEYKVDELRKSAIYEGLTVEERRVQFLWQALEDATPLQRRLFLRFVSGRDRLPIKLRVLPLITQGDPDASLPRAATCFFAIELPDYSSLEVMKRKLFYSIENCVDLDTDFTARSVDETEGPHLMLGVEDARPEELANATAED